VKTKLFFLKAFFTLLISVLSIPYAMAQSACTALWGTIDSDGTGATTVMSLRYFNTVTNRWVNVSPAVTLVGNANALAGDPTTGLLYYVNRTNGNLRVYNLNTMTDTVVGTINAPPAGGVGSILGATIATPGELIVLAVSGGNERLGRMSLTAPNSTTWTTILTVPGANPALGNSGDLYTNNAGQTFYASNTVASNTFLILDVNPTSPNYGRLTQSLVLSSGSPNLAGFSSNPVNGQTYIGTLDFGTYAVNTTTGAAAIVDPVTLGPSDMGNCVIPPAPPSVSKSFSPTYRPLGAGTTTLVLRINNTNTAPIWLFSDFVDTLPPGMQIATPNALNTGACASIGTTVTNVITATAGQTTVTFAAGGRIPAGGCTITLNVTAPANANAYVNDIPAGALQTSSGSNPTAVSASFKVGTDFRSFKQQSSTGALQTTSLAVLAGQTITYSLNIVNSSVGGTGSATFSDTVPIQLTPVLSVTALHSGGGSCNAVTSTLAGATVVSGTINNALAGSTCTVTVTALASGVSAFTTLTNALSITPTAGTSDTSATNNISTVTATIAPAANLQVTKNNGTNTLVAGGTVNYTVTYTNSGPSAASGALIQDTPSAGLSNCSVISCTGSGSPTPATCPGTIANLLAPSNTTIPSFPANSSASFVVRCGVTATGL
jgi:uncharacterized repeat protein (TIGR01451 family)